jgi:hypothetical protein
MTELARESIASGSSGGGGGGGDGATRELNASAGDCGGVVLIEKKDPTGQKVSKSDVNALMDGPGGAPDDAGLFTLLRGSNEWVAKWFVCQDGNMSIHEDEAAWHRFESIAVIPVDLLKGSDPKVRPIGSALPRARSCLKSLLTTALQTSLTNRSSSSTRSLCGCFVRSGCWVAGASFRCAACLPRRGGHIREGFDVAGPNRLRLPEEVSVSPHPWQ